MNRQSKTPAHRVFSRRTIALFAAAVLLLGISGVTGARAALITLSEQFVGDFELNELSVHLLENGEDVCHGQNTLQQKTDGELLADLEQAEPGFAYKEVIQAQNGEQNVDQYVRIILRKYWIDQDGNRTTAFDPSLIRLTYGKKAYNDSAWQLNASESVSPEISVYYYNKMLPRGESTDALFDSVMIDSQVLDKENVTEEKEGNVTYYRYAFDDFQFVIEAEAQALQTTDINHAIVSSWGVSDVTVDGGGNVRANQ